MLTAAKIIVLSSILLLMPLSVLSQDMNSVEKNAVAVEVFHMTQSLEELIQLLKDQHSLNDQSAELQRLEIAVAYLNFRSRRIEAKEQNLLERRFSRNRYEQAIATIKEKLDPWEEPMEQNLKSQFIQPFSEEQSHDDDDLLRELKGRMEKLDSEIIILENEIMSMTASLVEVETYVENSL